MEPRCPSLELPPLEARREGLTKEMRWIFSSKLKISEPFSEQSRVVCSRAP